MCCCFFVCAGCGVVLSRCGFVVVLMCDVVALLNCCVVLSCVFVELSFCCSGVVVWCSLVW